MKNDAAIQNEINLEPDYAAIRARFAAEAKLRAETILDGLLTETIVPFDQIRKVEVDVLRAFQSVLVPINVCIQAIDSNQAVLECRELMDAVVKIIIAKADEVEEAEGCGEGKCVTCGRRAVEPGVVLYGRPKGDELMCQVCTLVADEREYAAEQGK